jgi:hypothetical protein
VAIRRNHFSGISFQNAGAFTFMTHERIRLLPEQKAAWHVPTQGGRLRPESFLINCMRKSIVSCAIREAFVAH